MKKIFWAMPLAAVVFAAAAYGAGQKTLQFRAVVTEEEARSAASEKYPYAAGKKDKPVTILVNREVLLSDADIRGVTIRHARSGNFPVLVVAFNDAGAKKLEAATEKYLKRPLAAVWAGAVLMAPYIAEPVKSGKLQIVSWRIATDEQAVRFVKELGFEPEFTG